MLKSHVTNNKLVEKKIKFYLLLIVISLLLIISGCSGKSAPVEKTETPDSSNNNVNIYDYVNQLRGSAGMIPLTRNEQLENAAKNHALYITATNMVGHDEQINLPNFTGESAADGANHTGFLSRTIAEGVATEQSDTAAIDGLFSAIYHRFTLLSAEYDVIGIGFDLFNGNNKQGALVHKMSVLVRHLSMKTLYSFLPTVALAIKYS